ncbi:3-isopropylmalate dehydrogenase [Sulfobacillus harzensis]|uniref:3-isopropylmalate dehydrogenase n=1 Tax=Sulfobacillus harzensis TaxID=2729629 RepID=A0A7Y0L2T8_9FIRM|nr:3-isopropylmalate dehydrogenase [Sulfobacillus harzensis]
MGYKVAVLPGDGIGPEVTAAAETVLQKVASLAGFTVELERAEIGGSAIEASGHPFPRATEELVHRADAVLLGAVGGPRWANHPVTPEQGLLLLRESLGLFANLRPFEVFAGLESASPLKRPPSRGVIVRELLGGLYYGTPRGRGLRADRVFEAYDTSRYSVPEIERIARIGFQLAEREGVPLVSVDKANVLETSKLWRETVTRMADEYPGVSLVHRYVDAAAAELVTAPDRYRVAICENLFGDILSDLTGGLVGSLGVMASATVRQFDPDLGLYEPIHGSAPDIAGQGISNPLGAIGSVAMMLEWSFGLPDAAVALNQAVRRAVSGGVRTPDLGGQATTQDMTESVLAELEHAF